MSARAKHPTCARVVLDALVKHDSFVKADDVVKLTGLTKDQAIATLMHLHKYKALGVLEDAQGTWYYPTPDEDTRTRVLSEIKDNITRNRRPKAARKEQP